LWTFHEPNSSRIKIYFHLYQATFSWKCIWSLLKWRLIFWKYLSIPWHAEVFLRNVPIVSIVQKNASYWCPIKIILKKWLREYINVKKVKVFQIAKLDYWNKKVDFMESTFSFTILYNWGCSINLLKVKALLDFTFRSRKAVFVKVC